MVGTEKRIALVAEDLIHHFENRLQALDGKAMIVCMSRRICVDMYNAIIKLRHDWHSDDDDRGVVKIVMSGSASDRAEWQPHIRNKQRREALAKRFKDPADAMKVVIVRDMWLTGFDCPSLHTHVHRQADAGSRPDAGDSPSQPSIQRQTGWIDC